MPRTGRQSRENRVRPTAPETTEEKRVLDTNLTGRVKRFDTARSYGFVTRDDNGDDLFMHESSVWRYDLEPGVQPYFDEGQIVCFDLAVGRKGLEAINVTELTNLPTRDPRWRINNPLQPRTQNVNNTSGGASSAAISVNSRSIASANTASPLSPASPVTVNTSSPEIPAYLAGLEDVSSGDEHYYMMGYESSNDDEEFNPDREVSYPQFVRYYTDLKRASRLRAEEEAKKSQKVEAKPEEPAKVKVPVPTTKAASATESGTTASAQLNLEPSQDSPVCQLCIEEPSAITYLPCNHTIHCVDCAYRARLCTKCDVIVTKKLYKDGGKELVADNKAKITELVERTREIERAIICQICFDRKWDCVFDCGHSACETCAKPLKDCPYCRRKIKHKTKLY